MKDDPAQMGQLERDIRDGKIPGLTIDPDNPAIDREEMDIYSPPGTKVVFHGEGGWDSGESARSVLTVGQTYTVKHIDVGDWESWVSLEEAEGSFNSVHFQKPN